MCLFGCFFPIGLIIGSLICAEHQRQAKLPVATCDFRGGVFDVSTSFFGNKNGQHYETWTVNGTANYTFGEQSTIIQVKGMYPAPRQALNLQLSGTANSVKGQISENVGSCTLEISPSAIPNPNVIYTAYPEIISATTGIVLIIFAILAPIVVVFVYISRKTSITPNPLFESQMAETNTPQVDTSTDRPPSFDRNQSTEEPPPYDGNQEIDVEGNDKR